MISINKKIRNNNMKKIRTSIIKNNMLKILKKFAKFEEKVYLCSY